MASVFEITRIIVPLIIGIIGIIVYYIIMRKYYTLKSYEDQEAVKGQIKTAFMFSFFFLFIAIISAMFSVAYYFSMASESSDVGSVISYLGIIGSVAMVIPLFGVVSIILKKEKLIYIPSIYTIITAIVSFTTYETHVGTDFEGGYDKPATAAAFQLGLIVFVLIFLVVMLLNYIKLPKSAAKNRALWYSIAPILVITGLVVLNISHSIESSSLFTIAWFTLMGGALSFLIGQNIR